jgi:predicted amidohydrolase
VGALVLAGCIATYVIVLYVYGIKLVDLASKISELSQVPVIAHDPPPPPQEPGVVTFSIAPAKPPAR